MARWARVKAEIKAKLETLEGLLLEAADTVRIHCGQDMSKEALTWKISDSNPRVELQVFAGKVSTHSTIVGSYHAKDNVLREVGEHWCCSLKAAEIFAKAIPTTVGQILSKWEESSDGE